MADRYLKPFERPQKPHLVAHGKGGVAGEVADLREDVSDAFSRLAAEVDAGDLGLAPVADLTALGALDASGVDEGNIVYVNSVDDLYVLDKTDPHTPDGVTVIAANGGGNWVARILGRWNDVQGSVASGVGVSAPAYDNYRDTLFKLYCSRHDQDDQMNFSFQFTHTWDYSQIVVPHLHILPLADPAAQQIIYLSGYYTWSRPNNNEVPALAGWTPFNVSVPVDPGDVYIQKIASIGEVTPPAFVRESSVFLLHILREGTNIADTYSTNKDHGTAQANVGLLSFDVHYRANKHGSILQIPT